MTMWWDSASGAAGARVMAPRVASARGPCHSNRGVHAALGTEIASRGAAKCFCFKTDRRRRELVGGEEGAHRNTISDLK